MRISRKGRTRRMPLMGSPHPRRKGRVGLIDNSAVSEAREFCSMEFSVDFSDDNTLDDNESESGFFEVEDEPTQDFLCDAFASLECSSRWPTGDTSSSILRTRIQDKEPLHKSLSFADQIEKVHVVDNLKLCLTKREKSALWDAPPTATTLSSIPKNVNPLDLPLYEAGYKDDPLPIAASPRKDNKRRNRRRTQSRRRNFSPSLEMMTPSAEFSSAELSQELSKELSKELSSPKSAGKKSPLLSPMRSLTSRLGFRNRERMKSGILVPIRD